MNSILSKTIALLESLGVLVVTFLLAIFTARSPVGDWVAAHLHRNYIGHTIFILVPLIWLVITRRSLVEFGLTFRNLKTDLVSAMSCYLPAALAAASLGFVAFTQFPGALIEVIIHLAALYFVARALTGKPDPNSGLVTIVLSLLVLGGYSVMKSLLPAWDEALSSFVYYLFFIGFGEEVLYRGFILTRLNQAFARPKVFYGVAWGWGALIAAFLFGLTHVLNGWDLETGVFQPLWGWGLWTFFSALVYSYIREKTGSVVAGAVVHGLPQAIVYLVMRSFT